MSWKHGVQLYLAHGAVQITESIRSRDPPSGQACGLGIPLAVVETLGGTRRWEDDEEGGGGGGLVGASWGFLGAS